MIGKGDDFSVEDMGEFRIGVPAYQRVVLTNTRGDTDFGTITDTEAHGLILGTPIQGGVNCVRLGIHGIRMQEDTVLHLTPLGIYGETFRHIGKGIGLRTLVINIPSLEDIA